MVQLCFHMLHVCFVLLISTFQMCRGVETKNWSRERYPNPLLTPSNCSRNDPSYVCDPDNVLGDGEADKLDFIITRIRNDTTCICSGCELRHPGITIAVALMKSMENDESKSGAENAKDFAVYLLEKWNFGRCDDVVVILVSSVDHQSYVASGSTVFSVLSKELSDKIFESSRAHFDNGYFYQGLESIVESYYDVLRRKQQQQQHVATYKENKRTFNDRDITIALVVSVATLAALLVFLAILLYRMKKRQRKTTLRSNLTRWHNTKQMKSDDYRICDTDDRSDCNSEAESIEERDDANRTIGMFPPTKRQLSAVMEESENEEEEEEDVESEERSRTLSCDQKNNVNNIPRIPRFQHCDNQFSAEKDL
ncbi:uncharacterized protein LOC111640730 isoform X1 [Centruroides sculpturatus]|uniref:uncharacterized protein LOC111640730 isoform X1 n=2 Tax=Centruroides sculpturatus TaxID=218467 RepID=UPI000C6DDFFC|nr:uncharacterized protein LOC111640730 isoform X1 [Centruroides sculpturatus]